VAIVYGEMFESPIYPPFPGNYTKEKAKEIIKRRIQKKKSLTNGPIIGINIPMIEGWGTRCLLSS
jgi:alpha-D-ribose 1-methylphosphonate 5-phosphate C-P lyase